MVPPRGRKIFTACLLCETGMNSSFIVFCGVPIQIQTIGTRSRALHPEGSVEASSFVFLDNLQRLDRVKAAGANTASESCRFDSNSVATRRSQSSPEA
jgi:hypothetical protein